jgi:hypothetical protein
MRCEDATRGRSAPHMKGNSRRRACEKLLFGNHGAQENQLRHSATQETRSFCAQSEITKILKHSRSKFWFNFPVICQLLRQILPTKRAPFPQSNSGRWQTQSTMNFKSKIVFPCSNLAVNGELHSYEPCRLTFWPIYGNTKPFGNKILLLYLQKCLNLVGELWLNIFTRKRRHFVANSCFILLKSIKCFRYKIPTVSKIWQVGMKFGND